MEMTETRMTTLRKSSKPLSLALAATMTKGEAEASPLPLRRRGSS
jgi:hypothetical protein